jgi:hypothetical protein
MKNLVFFTDKYKIMSNNFKHTRTWRELLDEIPSIQWQKVAREPTPNTDYLIFKKLNKTLPLHRNNLVFKEVLPQNPRPPLEKGKLVCIAVNSHPKPLELNYSLKTQAQNNTKNSIKIVIDYRVDDAIILITEFDDALSEIEEYYADGLKTLFENQAELSSAALKNEIAALEVSQFGIFVEKVSVSNALEPESVEEEKSKSEQERIAELEMALYTAEQSNFELKQRLDELEAQPKVDTVNKKEEWLSLKKAKFLIAKKEEALKAKEEALTKEAERLAELEKRLQLKQSNQSREQNLAPQPAPQPAPEPPWLKNKPLKEEPDTFSPIAIDRQVELHEFEPIDYSEDDDEYEEMRKPSKIKTVIFILMVIIAIGVVVFYLPSIVALIKSLLEIG